MNETTLSKTAQSAETLAASLMIQELIAQADNLDIDSEYDVLLKYRDMLDILATIVASTFSPAEA
tara:strand:- start:366 stop:560 length:195 start_codon:yes stop_codon:yes gene_type:complete